jgi:hypothetical protein
MSSREKSEICDTQKTFEIESRQSPSSLLQQPQQPQQQSQQQSQQQQQQQSQPQQQQQQQQQQKGSDDIEVEHSKESKDKTDEKEKSLKRDSIDKVVHDLSTRKVRRSSTEKYRCVMCRTSFDFSQDLLEHLSESWSDKSDVVERKRSCVIRECFICDFVPDSRLADKYRSLQDHVITAHFKVHYINSPF